MTLLGVYGSYQHMLCSSKTISLLDHFLSLYPTVEGWFHAIVVVFSFSSMSNFRLKLFLACRSFKKLYKNQYLEWYNRSSVQMTLMCPKTVPVVQSTYGSWWSSNNPASKNFDKLVKSSNLLLLICKWETAAADLTDAVVVKVLEEVDLEMLMLFEPTASKLM